LGVSFSPILTNSVIVDSADVPARRVAFVTRSDAKLCSPSTTRGHAGNASNLYFYNLAKPVSGHLVMLIIRCWSYDNDLLQRFMQLDKVFATFFNQPSLSKCRNPDAKKCRVRRKLSSRALLDNQLTDKRTKLCVVEIHKR
jgi:hypothetical protein